MDLHCPATVICLVPGDSLPEDIAGQRLAFGYVREGTNAAGGLPIPVRPAPPGNLWQALVEIGDHHRGEGVVLFASAEELAQVDLRGVTLSVDSAGPVRVPATQPVDNADAAG